MPHPTILLRAVLGLLFLANVLGAALLTSMPSGLPETLAEFNLERSADYPWMYRIWLTTYGAYVAAIAGLWFLRPWARTLFTLAVIAMLAVAALEGPEAVSPLQSFLQVLTCTLDGIVLALAWLLRESRLLFSGKRCPISRSGEDCPGLSPCEAHRGASTEIPE